MVDMGQADRSLYAKPRGLQHKMCWTRALDVAAKRMGFDHYMDVPDSMVETMKTDARAIQVAADR